MSSTLHGQSRPIGYRELFDLYLFPYWRLVGVLATVLLSTIGLQLANPQILSRFINIARSGGTLGALTVVAGLFIAVAILTQVVSVAESYVAENLGWLATNRLRADLTLHCLQLDPSFHSQHTPGDLIERIDGDVTTLSNFFSRFVVSVLGNCLLLVGVIVLLSLVDWRIGGIMLLTLMTILLLVYRLRDIASPHWAAARQASADLFGFIEERLSGTEDIRSNGAVAYVLRRLYERMRTLLRKQIKATVIGVSLGWAIEVPLAVGTGVALATGAYLYGRGDISLGSEYLIFAYFQMLAHPIEELIRQLQDFQQAAGSISRVQDLLNLRSVVVDGPRDTLPSGPLSVEIDNVTFAYGGDEPVLQDISFTLPPGRVLGLLGRTGSGKTTISRLIFRLYDPQEGIVRLGGEDVRDVRLAGMRGRVGMVTQDIQLFHATVRDNLTFFDKSIPDDRVRDVLIDLGLWNWIKSLPQGLDTKLISGATGLSAGEAQLLAFARVFLKNPGLVVMDEASSRLDPATERTIEHAIDRLLEGRTGIMIAHRLDTVRRADDILILEDGRVVEWGPRLALADDPSSRFSTMLRMGLEEVLV